MADGTEDGMKPPIFGFERASTVDEALDLLNQHGDDARLIAGGQSLMAALNFRLSAPSTLIDISRIDALRGITVGEDAVRIGALTRHSEIHKSRAIAEHVPLLTSAAPHIAHEAIRNRGTIGGSIAFADPAAEWPACALALDATITVAGSGGATRDIAARDFFLDLYETAVAPGELVQSISFPRRSTDQRHAFAELTRRHGDYAIVGLAAVGQWRDASLTDLRLAFFGVGATPVLARQAMAALERTAGGDGALDRAGEALSGEIEPFDDLHASADMRRHLARVLLGRAVSQLVQTGRQADG